MLWVGFAFLTVECCLVTSTIADGCCQGPAFSTVQCLFLNMPGITISLEYAFFHDLWHWCDSGRVPHTSYTPLLHPISEQSGYHHWFFLLSLLSVSLDLLLYNSRGHIFQFLPLISNLVFSLRVFKFLPHFSRIGFFDCLRNVICEMFCSYTRLSKKGQTVKLLYKRIAMRYVPKSWQIKG